MLLFQPLVILFSGLILTVNGAEKTNYMINPVYINGKSPVWTLGDQKVIAWKTDLPVFNVSIWQQSPLGGSAYSRGNVFGMPEGNRQETAKLTRASPDQRTGSYIKLHMDCPALRL